jgi:hypothetical protein
LASVRLRVHVKQIAPPNRPAAPSKRLPERCRADNTVRRLRATCVKQIVSPNVQRPTKRLTPESVCTTLSPIQSHKMCNQMIPHGRAFARPCCANCGQERRYFLKPLAKMDIPVRRRTHSLRHILLKSFNFIENSRPIRRRPIGTTLSGSNLDPASAPSAAGNSTNRRIPSPPARRDLIFKAAFAPPAIAQRDSRLLGWCLLAAAMPKRIVRLRGTGVCVSPQLVCEKAPLGPPTTQADVNGVKACWLTRPQTAVQSIGGHGAQAHLTEDMTPGRSSRSAQWHRDKTDAECPYQITLPRQHLLMTARS